jgi:hypothetical protein
MILHSGVVAIFLPNERETQNYHTCSTLTRSPRHGMPHTSISVHKWVVEIDHLSYDNLGRLPSLQTGVAGCSRRNRE